MGTPFDTSKTGINEPKPLGPRPSGRKQDQYDKDMKAYNENEELKNKRLALLMDLNTMKESQDKTIKKIEEKQLDSGGFAWFDG